MAIAKEEIDWDAVCARKAKFAGEAKSFLDGVFGNSGGASHAE